LGLYLSVVLRPRILLEWGPRITLTAGVALALALQKNGVRSELKWPNDVMVDHRKVAGILTEASIEAKHISFVIVGVGINVNTDLEDFPVSIQDLATSLRLSTGKTISRVDLLQTFLYQLEQCYELLCQGSFETIMETWREYDSCLGRSVEVYLPESRVVGVAEDVDTDGALLVRDNIGRVHRIVVGDVVRCHVQGREGSQTH
jgi:BirA family biotin operon repressor/biotin-[acetyl-CoA-carboxylase] ligase